MALGSFRESWECSPSRGVQGWVGRNSEAGDANHHCGHSRRAWIRAWQGNQEASVQFKTLLSGSEGCCDSPSHGPAEETQFWRPQSEIGEAVWGGSSPGSAPWLVCVSSPAVSARHLPSDVPVLVYQCPFPRTPVI